MKKLNIFAICTAWGIAFTLSGAACTLGVGIAQYFPTFHALPLLLILWVAFIFICAINRISAVIFAFRHFGMPPHERRNLMKQHLADCKADPEIAITRYSDMTVSPILCLCSYFLLTLSIITTGGLYASLSQDLVSRLVGLGCLLAGCFLLFMPLYRLFERVSPRLTSASSTPLPHVEAIIERVFDTVGIKGKHRICLNTRYPLRIVPHGKTYVIHVSPYILSALTEEELTQLLLMQFDQFSRRKAYRYFSSVWNLTDLGSAALRWETFAFDLFFSRVRATMEWEFEFCYIAYQCLRAKKGLERVIREGNPTAAITGWGQICMWPYFSFEYDHHLPIPYYADPVLHHHHEQDVFDAFRNALQTRQAEWGTLLSRQILTEQARYNLLFRDYLDILCPDTPMPPLPISVLDASTPYGKDVLFLLEKFEKHRYEKNSVSYEADRESIYLNPLRITKAYEKSPESYSSAQLIKVIDAYVDLLRFDQAESICDAMIQGSANRLGMAHALYVKGVRMLHRYDTAGIDLIYRAIALNVSYAKEGYALIDEYCTLCGLEEEYAALLYRIDH